MNPVNPSTGTAPVNGPQQNQAPAKSEWSGRRIAMAVVGALAAVVAVIGGIFLGMKLSKKEAPGVAKETPELTFKDINKDLKLQKNESPLSKFITSQKDEDLANVLQKLENNGQARVEKQIQNDEGLATALQNKENKTQAETQNDKAIAKALNNEDVKNEISKPLAQKQSPKEKLLMNITNLKNSVRVRGSDGKIYKK